MADWKRGFWRRGFAPGAPESAPGTGVVVVVVVVGAGEDVDVTDEGINGETADVGVELCDAGGAAFCGRTQ